MVLQLVIGLNAFHHCVIRVCHHLQYVAAGLGGEAYRQLFVIVISGQAIDPLAMNLLAV